MRCERRPSLTRREPASRRKLSFPLSNGWPKAYVSLVRTRQQPQTTIKCSSKRFGEVETAEKKTNICRWIAEHHNVQMDCWFGHNGTNYSSASFIFCNVKGIGYKWTRMTASRIQKRRVHLPTCLLCGTRFRHRFNTEEKTGEVIPSFQARSLFDSLA